MGLVISDNLNRVIVRVKGDQNRISLRVVFPTSYSAKGIVQINFRPIPIRGGSVQFGAQRAGLECASAEPELGAEQSTSWRLIKEATVGVPEVEAEVAEEGASVCNVACETFGELCSEEEGETNATIETNVNADCYGYYCGWLSCESSACEVLNDN